MTARKQSINIYFTDVLTIVSAVFSSYFLLFVTFGPTSSASQSEVVAYTVSGHSHTLDTAIHEHSIRDNMCSMRIGRDVTSIVAACRRSAWGMCSMNTSRLKGNFAGSIRQTMLP